MLVCQTGQQFILRETGLQLKLSRLCRLCAHLQAIYPRKNQPFVCPLLERVAIRLRGHIFGVQTNFARLLGNGTD